MHKTPCWILSLFSREGIVTVVTVSCFSLYPAEKWQGDCSLWHSVAKAAYLGRRLPQAPFPRKLFRSPALSDDKLSWTRSCLRGFVSFVNLVVGPLLSLLNSSLLWLCFWLVPMLFSMPVFGEFPIGPGACMHYLHFHSPQEFWLYSASYKIHSCCTTGESLCHWDFSGSIPKKKRA